SVGIAVLFALFRGFTNKEKKTIGNFWVDLTKITLHIMLPICFFGAIFLVSQGVPQSFSGSISYVGLDGLPSNLYFGGAASQIIIKQLFTNGGGFFGTNSAYPFENPTAFSNLVQCLSILVIPVGLCFTFAMAVKDKKQGTGLLKAMTAIFTVCLIICTVFEFIGEDYAIGILQQGNMEGKESRFGVGASALWAVATTAASNGSVNAMLDSFTGIGGMIPLFLMMLGEVVYGGVGSGLYGMIGFAILTVFIGGLMVGRTPEYLGKKVGAFDMKMVCLIILPPVLCTLIGTAATVMLPQATSWLTNNGAHGFSEILYAFTSMGNNNGSAFAGFNGNTIWTNLVGGISMLIVRFIPMIAVIFMSESLSKKKSIPVSSGTLSTTNPLFVGMLIAVILIVGALSFFPALALGPIADHLG
ncbi:MAG: potassium-transporting ATPase subunit KdpA, partial [Clostridia bacterium]